MKVPTFPEGISPKVNIIAQQGLDLAYLNSTVQHFRHLYHRDFPQNMTITNKIRTIVQIVWMIQIILQGFSPCNIICIIHIKDLKKKTKDFSPKFIASLFRYRNKKYRDLKKKKKKKKENTLINS